ncbi:YceI family protein [Agromyces sp. Soil535]|uniref:YceI family protein n=1 Tax=Agromyces sp. Soil535 TaxID=1736390 RepID=UPI0006F20697|nr:YceI family protein [Agromyces sp. Soil535]KRE29411.1 polyisoprenoid-binding protein [Agromyces sp. Soil535]
MKRRTIVTISIIAGVVLLGGTAAVAGPIVYRDLIVGEAEAAPTVTAAPSASASTIDAAELSGSWVVADGSFAGYRVDEVLNDTDVTVVGRTEEVTGSFTVDDLTLTAAEITVDLASITTDSTARDGYFRDNALRVSEYPTATFVLTGPVTAASAPAVGEVQTLTATGDLTIAGVTRTMTVELEAVLNDGSGQIAGSIPVTFADFGVEAPSLGFVSVEPEGFVEFSLVIAPA